nr:hypothetical protein [Eubacterium sp.]
MLGWEGRILDNKSIMIMKAALPFLDIPVGETVDMEGLLRAVRCFCKEKEQRLIDMLLNVFMMKRVFSIMSMMNEMNADPEHANGGMEYMMELLKSQMPKEQQEMLDMMAMMMSAAGGTPEDEEQELKPESEQCQETTAQESVMDHAIPDIWQSIVENSEKGMFDDQPE